MKKKYRGKLKSCISVEDIEEIIWVDEDYRIHCEKGFKGNSRVLINCVMGNVKHGEDGVYIDFPEVVVGYNFEVLLKKQGG